MERLFYVVRCADHSLYLGHTTSLTKTIDRLSAGGTHCPSTVKKRLPVKLLGVWSQGGDDINAAKGVALRFNRESPDKREDLWLQIISKENVQLANGEGSG